MIDFIDVTIPFENDGEINNGYKDSTKKGEIANRKYFSVPVKLNGTRIQVVSIDNEHIRISGNPAKFIQGQNVFGTDNLTTLTSKVAKLIAKELGVAPTRENKRSWRKGDFDVHRIDLTNNFVFPSQTSLCQWMDKAFMVVKSRKQAINADRSSSSDHVETIYVGKNSTYISLKFYNKYREMLANRSNTKKEGQADPMILQLMDEAKPLLRCEIRLHKRYLKTHGLIRASTLTPEVIWEHFIIKLDRVSLGTSELLPVLAIEKLGKNERLAYECWVRGGNIQELVSKSTFDRLRNRVIALKPGLDIRYSFVEQTRGRSLKSYLDPRRIAAVPDFLIDTSWYYDPK